MSPGGFAHSLEQGLKPLIPHTGSQPGLEAAYDQERPLTRACGHWQCEVNARVHLILG